MLDTEPEVAKDDPAPARPPVQHNRFWIFLSAVGLLTVNCASCYRRGSGGDAEGSLSDVMLIVGFLKSILKKGTEK